MEDYLKSFQDYLEINENLSILSIQKYVSCVRKFLLECGTEFTIKTINSYIKTKAKQDMFAIKKFFLSRGMRVVADKLTHPKKKTRKKQFKYVSKDVIQNIINYLTGKYRYMAFLQYKAGVRVQEVLTLRAEYFDFQKNNDLIIINVGAGKSLSKGTKSREVFIHKKYEGVVRKILRNKNWGYLFLNEEAEKLSKKELVQYVENQRRYYGKQLAIAGNVNGVEGMASHYLRHLFADEYYKHTGDIASLRKILGHAKIDTTLTYIGVENQVAMKAIVEMG